jgi:plastocyanin
MRRRTLLLGGGAMLLATAATARAQAPTPAPAPARQIIIDQHAFGPDDLEVPVGSVIEWINRDVDEHNVTEKNRRFQSPILDTGEHWTRSFGEPGVVEYYCSLHPHMTGRIRVVA